MNDKIGYYAFIVGVVIALIAGLITDIPVIGPYVPLILVVLGLVVGFLNVSDKETDKFLLAAIALVLVGAISADLGQIPFVGNYLGSIVSQIAVFVAPAALVVAIKAIWDMGKTPNLA